VWQVISVRSRGRESKNGNASEGVNQERRAASWGGLHLSILCRAEETSPAALTFIGLRVW
jgi:hypothetical protein